MFQAKIEDGQLIFCHKNHKVEDMLGFIAQHYGRKPDYVNGVYYLYAPDTLYLLAEDEEFPQLVGRAVINFRNHIKIKG